MQYTAICWHTCIITTINHPQGQKDKGKGRNNRRVSVKTNNIPIKNFLLLTNMSKQLEKKRQTELKF